MQASLLKELGAERSATAMREFYETSYTAMRQTACTWDVPASDAEMSKYITSKILKEMDLYERRVISVYEAGVDYGSRAGKVNRFRCCKKICMDALDKYAKITGDRTPEILFYGMNSLSVYRTKHMEISIPVSDRSDRLIKVEDDKGYKIELPLKYNEV